MKSYSTNRQQYSKIDIKHLTKQNINCSVTPGSSLEPLLFTLYINNLPSVSLFSSTLFAYNTFLSIWLPKTYTILKKVNSELKFVHDCLRNDKLSLNYSKTFYLIFNKPRHISVNSKFSIHMNQSKIEKVIQLNIWDCKLTTNYTDFLMLNIYPCSWLILVVCCIKFKILIQNKYLLCYIIVLRALA